MLPVSLLNLQSNIKSVQGQYNSKFQSVPYFSPKYNKNLTTDVVSFSGNTSTFSRDAAREKIEKSFEKTGIRSRFGDKSINSILDEVNPKNEKYLEAILAVGTKNLGKIGVSAYELIQYRDGVIELLKYAGDEKTIPEEFEEKFNNFRNMKKIVKNNFGFVNSILADYIDDIPMKSAVDLIKSDLLFRSPRHNFNSFPDAYNYAVKYFNHQISKANDDLQKNKMPELDDKGIKIEVDKLMRSKFSNLLILAMIFDETTCNEFMNNRGKYIDTVYMPRLRMLNGEDFDFLRRVQTSGVTYKDNKGGTLSKYGFSLDDKIYVLNLLAANRVIQNAGGEGINCQDYMIFENPNNKDGNFKLDFQKIKRDLMDKSLRHIGVSDDVVDKYMRNYDEAYEQDPSMKNVRNRFWDINYAHLLPLKATEGTLIRDIIVNGTYGPTAFRKFLFGEGEVAEINEKNRTAFEKAGINYDAWIEPPTTPVIKIFKHKDNPAKNKEFKAEIWRRNPQESLFDGNYTSCCTGIDKDQGDSFPIFLTNTATTTLEVRTDKNKVLAMSRLLIAKINGKPSLVVENIEVNNKMAKHYLYNDETKQEFREMIFEYVRQFAKDINNGKEDIPVYFCGYYYKLSDIAKGLKPVKDYDDVELIGEYPNGIWINSYGRRYEPNKAAYADDGDGFAFKLHDITVPTAKKIDTTKGPATDADYNYEDIGSYGHY